MLKLLGCLTLAACLLVLVRASYADPADCTDACVEITWLYVCTLGTVCQYELKTCAGCGNINKVGWVNCEGPGTVSACQFGVDTKYYVWESGIEVCPKACQNKSGGATPTFVQGFPYTPKYEEFTIISRRECKGPE